RSGEPSNVIRGGLQQLRGQLLLLSAANGCDHGEHLASAPQTKRNVVGLPMFWYRDNRRINSASDRIVYRKQYIAHLERGRFRSSIGSEPYNLDALLNPQRPAFGLRQFL